MPPGPSRAGPKKYKCSPSSDKSRKASSKRRIPSLEDKAKGKGDREASCGEGQMGPEHPALVQRRRRGPNRAGKCEWPASEEHRCVLCGLTGDSESVPEAGDSRVVRGLFHSVSF